LNFISKNVFLKINLISIIRGVPDETLIKVLTENGFNHETSIRLIYKAKKEGTLINERNPNDIGQNLMIGSKD